MADETRQRVLDFVCETYLNVGVPPTAREIAAALDMVPSGVYHHLNKLVRTGHLVHRARKYLPAPTEGIAVMATLDTTQPTPCPFDGPSHDYAESVVGLRLYCRKCADQIALTDHELAQIGAAA